MRATKTPLGNYFYGDVYIKKDEYASSTGFSKRYIIKTGSIRGQVFDTLKAACAALDQNN